MSVAIGARGIYISFENHRQSFSLSMSVGEYNKTYHSKSRIWITDIGDASISFSIYPSLSLSLSLFVYLYIPRYC